MRQQLLDPVGSGSVADVVRRLGAVPATPHAAAELAVGARRSRHRPGDVARALADGRLIKTFAFRGATHLLTPEDGGVYLALRAASRMWELPSWQSFYGLPPSDWPHLREAVRDEHLFNPLLLENLADDSGEALGLRAPLFEFPGVMTPRENAAMARLFAGAVDLQIAHYDVALGADAKVNERVRHKHPNGVEHVGVVFAVRHDQ